MRKVKLVTMVYATSTLVKQRMGITTSAQDTIITAAIVYSDALCDELIQVAGGSTPIGTPPNSLKEASADFAAYYMHRIKNQTMASLFWNSGMTMINAYITRSLAGGGAEKTGRAGVRDE